MKPAVRDLFWLLSKVDTTEPGECWTWQAAVHPQSGYGTAARWGRGLGPHRIAWVLAGNRLNDWPREHLDHLCRNRACCNPAHLELVTARENIRRGVSKVARQMAQTHCVHGHPFSGGNLFYDNVGRRKCRECSRANQARYDAERRAAMSTSVDTAA